MKSMLLFTPAPAASFAPGALRARAGSLESRTMKLHMSKIIGLSVLLLLPIAGNIAVLTTRQQPVRPLAIPADTRQISPKDVPLYKFYGYSAWQVGPGVDRSEERRVGKEGRYR